jgi:chromosomal replication initiator protein
MTHIDMQEIAAPEGRSKDLVETLDAAGWARVAQRLRAEVGDDVFNSWFARLDLEYFRDGNAFLTVPTKFLKSWIDSHYLDRIKSILATECERIERVSVSVRTSGRIPVARPLESNAVAIAALGAPQAAQRPNFSGERAVSSSIPLRDVTTLAAPSAVRTWDKNAGGLSGSPLDARLTFDTFLVGRSNQLAHAAALRMIETGPNAVRYNPLYVHASVGLGKTHLLQAIAHGVTASGRRVIYLTAERFMYGFVAALKSQTAIAFKEKLRGIDTLIIDDIQFLQGKQIQQEFCHTLNALIDAGRQIVTAADRPPSELESLDERVRSRLAGGLSVEMGPLDEALRVKILEARIANAQKTQANFDVPPTIVTYLARTLRTNGRDLDGAINRLLAHTTLTGTPLTTETAEIAVSDLVRSREPKRVKIEDIQKLVASHYNVSRSDLLSARRTAAVVRPRQIAMYLSKVLTLRSLPEIGRRFGGRDHTTVLHAVRKIDGLAGKDASLAEVIELLKRILTD